MRNRATVNSAATKIGEGTARSVCTCKYGRKEARKARSLSTRNRRFLPRIASVSYREGDVAHLIHAFG